MIYRLLLVLLFFGFSAELRAQEGVLPGKIRLKITEAQYGLLSPLNPSEDLFRKFTKKSGAFAVKSIRPVFPIDPRHEDRMKAHGLHLWYEVEVENQSLDLDFVKGNFNEVLDLELTESIYRKVPTKTQQVFNFQRPSVAMGITSNDPRLADQWHYENTGQTTPNGLNKPDINLLEAWEVETGDPGVVVAVVDLGIQFDHEDLAANMWENTAEVNGINGVDDDRNGYVDDKYGYNFIQGETKITPGTHGTHVAGTIAAVSGNGIGVAGIAGGKDGAGGVKLMSCQIFEAFGGGSGAAAPAIIYAANNGAVICQNSWGYTVAGVREQAVLTAIDYFIENAGDYEGSLMQGGIVIFSAGNDNADDDWYPNVYEPVMAVGSIGPEGKKAPYSNFGEWVDISAPGGDVLNYGQSGQVLSTGTSNSEEDVYAWLQGTSMSCPHVSGVAALVVSHFGGPEFTVDDLYAHLYNGAGPHTGLEPLYLKDFGMGLIDAAKALADPDGVAPASVTDLTGTLSGSKATLGWTSSSNNAVKNVVSYKIYYSTSPLNEGNLESASMLELYRPRHARVEISTEVENLDQAAYYVGVVAVGPFGEEAPLSNVVLITDGALSVNTAIFDDFRVSNPVQDGMIHVKNSMKYNIEAFDLYDLNGAHLARFSGGDQDLFRLPIPELQNGVYVLYIKTDEGDVVKRILN